MLKLFFHSDYIILICLPIFLDAGRSSEEKEIVWIIVIVAFFIIVLTMLVAVVVFKR